MSLALAINQIIKCHPAPKGEGERKCPRCKEVKPISEFNPHWRYKKLADGGKRKHPNYCYCKPCDREYNKQWWDANGEIRNGKRRKK